MNNNYFFIESIRDITIDYKNHLQNLMIEKYSHILYISFVVGWFLGKAFY